MAKWEDDTAGAQVPAVPGLIEGLDLTETGLAVNRAMADWWAAGGPRTQGQAQERLLYALAAHLRAVGEHYSTYPTDETPETPQETTVGEQLDPPPYDGPKGSVPEGYATQPTERRAEGYVRRRAIPEPPDPIRGKHRPRKRWFQIWRRW